MHPNHIITDGRGIRAVGSGVKVSRDFTGRSHGPFTIHDWGRTVSPEMTTRFDACVPVRVADEVTVRLAPIDARARWMLAFIDGRSELATVLASAGLPIEDAREAVTELVLQGIVALGTSPRGDGWSSRPR